MAKLRDELVKKLEKISGLEERPSKVRGGSAIFYKDKEIAHFHHDNEIDVRLTKKIIRQEGLSHPDDSEIHRHRSPTSQWIEIRFKNSADVNEAVRLFKLALEQYQNPSHKWLTHAIYEMGSSKENDRGANFRV